MLYKRMLKVIISLCALASFALGKSFHHQLLPKFERRNFSQLFSNYGGKIVGGEDATIEDYPYQVSVELFGEHWCGGSLLLPNVVLTAAHCMTHPVLSYTVRAGSTIKEEGGQVADAVAYCNHPNYHPDDYDVSVILLDRSFNLGTGVQLISLQPIGEPVPDDTIATVTGWGTLFAGGPSPTILQKVDVPKVNDELCGTVNYPGYITERMTCYGYPEGGKDSCQGDSGGPLVVNGKQVGIVSWGQGCAFPRYPGIYARVENNEIQDHINSCVDLFSRRK